MPLYFVCVTKQQPSTGERGWSHRADNRQRLIDAGYEVLSGKGFEATTVKEISRVAGVSPGLFHYYFASKSELLLAVYQESDKRILAIFQELGKRFKERVKSKGGASSTADYTEASVEFIKELARREPQLFRLQYELYALGLRNPDFLPAVGERLAEARGNIGRTMLEFTDIEESRVRALSAVILACFDGLALQQLAQPEADLAPAYEILRELIVDSEARSP